MSSSNKQEEIPLLDSATHRNTISFFNLKPPKKQKKRVINDDDEFEKAIRVDEEVDGISRKLSQNSSEE